MTDKDGYSKSVAQHKASALTDKHLAQKIAEGQSRASSYKSNWQSIDFNEFLSRFAPGSVPVEAPGNPNKLYYQTPGRSIRVVVDIGGGYCRLQDMSTHYQKAQFLDINGHDAHNYKDANGKTHGRSPAEFNEVTHFRIKKKGE